VVDVTDEASVQALFDGVGKIDAVVTPERTCATAAPSSRSRR
jgi:hypothetical protein